MKFWLKAFIAFVVYITSAYFLIGWALNEPLLREPLVDPRAMSIQIQ